jgi:hypothetical protein
VAFSRLSAMAFVSASKEETLLYGMMINLERGRLCDRLPYVHIFDIAMRISDLWMYDAWNFSRLHTLLPQAIVHEI